MFGPKSHLTSRSNHLFLEDVDCFALAQQQGTPLYATSETRLRENIRAYHRAFPDADKYFAVKSNGNLTLLRIAAQESMGADVFSAGELSVVRMVGIPQEKILYNGNSKSEEDHEMAIQAGVRMSVDSREELEHLACTAQKMGREAEILFRVNSMYPPRPIPRSPRACAPPSSAFLQSRWPRLTRGRWAWKG